MLAVLAYQDCADHRDLQGRRKDVEDHRRQHKADTLGASIDGSRQTARLPAQMEVQVQPQEMVKHISCNLTNGLLRDAGKDRISQFLEEGRANPRRTICSS